MDDRAIVSKNGRLAQATRHLQDQALDGLIAASNGLNNFLDSNAVYVLGGVRPIGESAVVLDRDGASTLIVTPAWDGERAAALSSTDRTIGTDDLVATLQSVVRTYRLDMSRTLSVGLSLLGRGLLDRIASALGTLPKAADELARDLARVRTAEELAAAQRATWIAERGYERLIEYARPGLREFELAAEVYCFMKKLGAEDNFLLMSASQHNHAVRAAGERVLDVGDIILSEITPCYRGQFVQICRTTVIGEPRPLVREKFAILQDAMREGLAAGHAGARVADVTRAINGVLQRNAVRGLLPAALYARARPRPRNYLGPSWRYRRAQRARAGKRHGVRHASQPVHPGERLSDVRRDGRGVGERRSLAVGAAGTTRRYCGLRPKKGKEMQTMHPSIMLGSYVWAQDRLPQDEFVLRLEELRAAMEPNGWQAVLVYGDAREHAGLAFLSNFIPRMRWGMALLPRTGEARLLCAMSTRDLPAMRTMTWIADVQSGMGPEWEKAFDPWFARFNGKQALQLGTIGFDLMASALHEQVRRSLGERFSLHRADDILAIPSSRKRPRELTMIRASCKVLEAAAKAFAKNWRVSREPETAALDGERVARSLAAQDVRTLISLDGGRTLVPYQGRFEKSAGPLVGYIAVKVLGYWADMFITIDDGPATSASRHAEAALDALVAAVRPGARTAEIYAKTVDALLPFKLHPVLGASVGHGIGLSLHERPEFRAAGDSALVEDGVYALQVGIADAQSGHVLISAIVRNTAKGAEVLARSPSIAAG